MATKLFNYKVTITTFERIGRIVQDYYFETKYEAENFRENQSHKDNYINGIVKEI